MIQRKTLTIHYFSATLFILCGILTPCIADEVRLTADNGSPDDWFGKSVSISDDRVVIGADGVDPHGAVYVFRRDEGEAWYQAAMLRSGEDVTIGTVAAISGDYVIAGAPSDDVSGDWSGSAYIFRAAGDVWEKQMKLIPEHGSRYDYFGVSAAIDEDVAIVGAYGDNEGAGSAYIFVNTGETWRQQARLTAQDGEPDDRFGASVSVSGDYAIAGAWKDDDKGKDAGAAYIFKRSGETWIQQVKLTAEDGVADDRFGYSVAISGDYVIAGAWKDDDNGGFSGSAYIFGRDGELWTQRAKLLADDGDADDRFGYSVAISGDYAVVGAWKDDDKGPDAGAAYIFKHTGEAWEQLRKVSDDHEGSDDRFGWSVAVSGAYAIAGAWKNDDNGEDAGSASVFTLFENHAPDQPVIISPSEGETVESIHPELRTGAFSDPDQGNIHAETRWQISTISDFSSVILDDISSENLTTFVVIEPMLHTSMSYCWRVRFFDNYHAGSEWSVPVCFKIPHIPLPPVAFDGTLETRINLPASGMLAAEDPNGEPLIFSIVSDTSRAVIDNQTNGRYTYTPEPDQLGEDSFTFKAVDGDSDSNTATIRVTIKPAIIGDVNADEVVDLKDAIMAMKLLTATQSQGIYPDADADGDEKIGLAELIYILRKLQKAPEL